MRRHGTTCALLLAAAICLIPAWAAQKNEPPKVIQVNPPPPVQPVTVPVTSYPQSQSPLSIDSTVNTQGYMRFEPYNTYPRELDLWNLEGRRFLRSDAVVAPGKDAFVYSEVLFMPSNRQTMSRLFLVPVKDPPAENLPLLPSEEVLAPAPPPPQASADRFDPVKTYKLRQPLVAVGFDRVVPYEFRTLTVVDWSVSGQKMLFKQRSGVLHVGLRTSDILVYDRFRGTITIYPEVSRVIQHYWKNVGNLPHIEDVAWDIQPLGWEVGSDSAVLLKAWAYDKHEKKFLGVWRYDVDAERTELVSLQDMAVPVAANGLLARYQAPPPETRAQRREREKLEAQKAKLREQQRQEREEREKEEQMQAGGQGI